MNPLPGPIGRAGLPGVRGSAQVSGRAQAGLGRAVSGVGRVAAPGGGVRLRRLRWWHIEQVVPLEAELFGAEQWSTAMFWNELASGHHYLIAVEPAPARAQPGAPPPAEEVLGYAGLAVGPPDEAWVQNIAVRRAAQRRGIGRTLLEALLTEARRRGVQRVLLEVAVDNGPAQHLYGGYGFEAVGIRRGYYQPSNTDALVMLCQLNAAGAAG